MQAARRSAIFRRCSIAASSNIPASEVRRPPSKATCTGLPPTAGKPGKIPVVSSMAGANSVASFDPALATKSYTKPKTYTAPANPCSRRDELFRLDQLRGGEKSADVYLGIGFRPTPLAPLFGDGAARLLPKRGASVYMFAPRCSHRSASYGLS